MERSTYLFFLPVCEVSKDFTVQYGKINWTFSKIRSGKTEQTGKSGKIFEQESLNRIL